MSTEMDDKPRVRTEAERQEHLKDTRLNKQRNNNFNTKKSELKEYLLSIDPEKAADALIALVQIASDHKSATLTVFNENDARHERIKTKSVKKAMQELQALLEKLNIKLKSIPISDLALFNTMMHEIQSRHIKQSAVDNDPTISFTKLIDEAYETTEAVIQEQGNHTEQSKDKHRTVLACNVALVIKNILKMEVSITPHTNLGPNSKPTTGLYSRLLDMTLKLADESSVDMQKLKTAGKKLSEDGTLPHLIN